MGAVLSMASRKVRRFNVEQRAQRVIEQDKPTAAPKYESNVRDLQKVLDENPDWVKEQGKKSAALDDRLKQVYVTSTDPEALPRFRADGSDPSDPAHPPAARALPLDRKPTSDFEYGYKEPEKVSRGRATLRQAIKFISDHQNEPEGWTVERIADEYKLKEPIVADILQNFHTFEIYIPDIKSKESVLISKPTNKLIDSGHTMDRYQPQDYDAMEEKLTGSKEREKPFK